MYRLLTPILAFIVAFTLFFTFIEPTFEDYKKIDSELADYEQALASAQLLQERVNELIADKNSIAQSDLERLMTFLPNSIDEVGIVLVLDSLAGRHSLALDQISVKSSRSRGSAGTISATQNFAFEDDTTTYQKEQTRPDGTVVKKPTDNIETITLSFSVTGTYEDFKALILELEQSLALIDITNLDIKGVEDEKLATYSVGVALYQFVPKE